MTRIAIVIVALNNISSRRIYEVNTSYIDAITASSVGKYNFYGAIVGRRNVNPLGVEVSAKGEFKEDGSDGSLDIYEYIAFDKYGYINKLDAKIDIKSVSKIGEESYEMKMFTEVHATISYK